jgi:hypothetical protein
LIDKIKESNLSGLSTISVTSSAKRIEKLLH